MKTHEATKIIIQECQFPQLNDVPKERKEKKEKEDNKSSYTTCGNITCENDI